MRILLVTDWNRGHGGAEAYAAWLRAGLADLGEEVRLLTSGAGSAAADTPGGRAEYVAFGTDRAAAQAFLQVVNPFAFARVRAAVREFRPDVAFLNMFAHHLSPAVLKALEGVPIFFLVTDYKVVCPIGSKLLPDGSICEVPAGWVCHREGCVSLPHWIRDRPRYALLRALLPRVERVVACSRWVQRELARAGIPAGIEMLPVPPPGPDYVRAPSAEPLFVYTGRLDVEKGVDTLVRAFARVRGAAPRARLRIVGSGPRRAALERLAAGLGVAEALHFTGWLAPDQVEREVARAWAVVAPSLWAEPLGFVAIEAVVRGVPVLASVRGGFTETVEDGISGLLHPNGDEEALAADMVDVALRRRFADHAVPADAVRRASRRHDLGRHLARMRTVLHEVAEAGSRSSSGRPVRNRTEPVPPAG